MRRFGYNKKSKFTIDTVLALNLKLKLDQFMYNLVHYSPYKLMLYIWIHKLYLKGKSSEQAVQFIYKAKRRYLLQYGCRGGE